ncbi:MAG: protein translocase subunit SecD [Planctomycetes bacterium]|nr:protein translocase subunit SecD [Planctomycetota bacterium]
MNQRIALTLAALCLVTWGSLSPSTTASGQTTAVSQATASEPTKEVSQATASEPTKEVSQATAAEAAPVKPEPEKPRVNKVPLTPEKTYKTLDQDGDLRLTVEEMVGEKSGIDASEAKSFFGKWDKDGNGTLTIEEFKAGLAATATPWYRAWYSVLGLLALVVLVSVAFGTWIGPLLRMPEASWKFTVVALAILSALALMWLRWPPKLGIDLNGGTILAYELDKGDRDSILSGGGSSEELMKRLIGAITKRVDPAGVKLVTIRSIGKDAIEVIVPEVDPTEVAMLKQILQTTGHLEFRILADPNADQAIVERARRVDWKVEDPSTDARHSSKDEVTEYLIGEAKSLEDKRAADAQGAKPGEKPPLPEKVVTLGGQVRAQWFDVPAKDVAAALADKDLVTRTIDGKTQKLVILGVLKARWIHVGLGEDGRPRFGVNMNGDRDRSFVSRDSRRGEGIDVLVLVDSQNVEGRYLKLARTQIGPDLKHSVDFEFNSEGARLFGDLTGNNLPKGSLVRKLGIVLDDQVLSAPNLQSRISEKGQITGDFSKAEVEWLVGVLDAGSLPAKLNPTPISEMRADATLGEETIRQGALAIMISLVIVPLAMIAYYRFAGLVAGVAVLLNLLLVVAIMVSVQAAFTLAGLAGLVLTVGMSVDANVLIYERMREELERGSALRMAIRNGFSRATRTIVDSNATNIITAVVLYAVGTEQLKGFAVTLILGILISMFTAIFCARLVFDVCERNRWITTLRMTKAIGETNVNFVRAMPYCIAASQAVIAIGLVAVFLRGSEFLDIDFRGGTKIEVVFKDKQTQKQVEARLKEYSEKAPEAARLDAVTASGVGEGNKIFDIETVQSNTKVVQDALKQVFKGELKTNRLTFEQDEVKTIAGALAPDATVPKDIDAKAPAPEKPAPAKSAPAPEPGKPAPGDGTQRSTGSARTLFAAVDPQSLFLGQVEPEAGKKTPEPNAAEKTPIAGALPVVQPTGAASLPVVQPTQVEVDTAAASELSEHTIAGQSFVGGTSAQLNFEDKIKQDVLSEMIRQAARGIGLVKAAEPGEANPAVTSEGKTPQDLNFQFRVTHPDVVGESQVAQTSWTLDVTLNRQDTQKLLNALQIRLADEPVFPMATNVGNQVAGSMQLTAFSAVFISFLAIVAYLWLRFQHVRYGLAAVVALVHDVLVTVGILALTKYFAFIPFMEGFRMNLVILAAILTLIGYSLNDTIVIFDRIRELKGKSPHITKKIVNDAVNQTLSRTLLTSLLTFVVVGVLFFVGGPGVHGFSFTLLIGIIVGTFSSIYIAAPVLLWMEGSVKDVPRSARSAERKATTGTA